jgi:sterol desaturase/sphingolipid hydroxylase (fatty acid hydroxylase superfamily)
MEAMQDAAIDLADWLTALALSPSSPVSLWSLGAAFMIACAVVIIRRGGRSVRMAALVRAMVPRQWRTGASARADGWFTLFALFGSAALLGGAIASHLVIAEAVADLLGAPLALGVPAWLAIGATTLVLWIAYEFAYFLDHYLAHRWRWLWAFHKVHHSAEHLSPLTVFRVHPVDSIVFYNIVAIATGVAGGVMRWLLGAGVSPWTIAGANVLAIAGLMTIKHLHHSHVWIAWGGIWGRLILSPAHHQIHHSVAPEHHDRNFGDVLGVFDWLAGTLHQPSANREPLRFGVDGYADPHSVKGALLTPFVDAALLARATVSGHVQSDEADTSTVFSRSM